MDGRGTDGRAGGQGPRTEHFTLEQRKGRKHLWLQGGTVCGPILSAPALLCAGPDSPRDYGGDSFVALGFGGRSAAEAPLHAPHLEPGMLMDQPAERASGGEGGTGKVGPAEGLLSSGPAAALASCSCAVMERTLPWQACLAS